MKSTYSSLIKGFGGGFPWLVWGVGWGLLCLPFCLAPGVLSLFFFSCPAGVAAGWWLLVFVVFLSLVFSSISVKKMCFFLRKLSGSYIFK